MMHDAKHSPRPDQGRNARRWWLYVLTGPLLLIFTFVALFLFLRTDHGLQRAERLLNSLLSDVGGQQVVLSGLHGRFPFELRLAGLHLADKEGIWLEVEDPALRWSGRDLLAARIRVLELSANRVEMFRTPASAEPKTRPEPRETFPAIELPETIPRAALDNLDIRRIILAEAVAGDRLELSLTGDLDAGSEGLQLNLAVDSMDGFTGEGLLLRLHAGFNALTSKLSLRAEFADPKGALAPFLGLPQSTPLSLRLQGDGPAASWNGEVAARAGELITLDSSLALGWQGAPSLDWQGEMDISPVLLPIPLDAYLSAAAFQVAAEMPNPQTLRIAKILLHNPQLHASLSADLDLSRSTLLGDMDLELTDTDPLNALAGVDLGPAICLRVAADGPFNGPDLQLKLGLTDVFADPARIAGLGLDAAVQFMAAAPGHGPVIAATGALAAQGLDVPGTALPPDLTLGFAVDYRFTDAFVDLKHLALHGQDLDLRASAGYALESSRLDARLELQPSSIQPWLAPYGLEDAAGEADLRVTAQGTVQPMDLDIVLHTGLNKLAGLPEPLPPLLGEAPKLQAQVRLLPPEDGSGAGPGRIEAQNVRLQASGLELIADADYSMATAELSAQAVLTLPNLSLAAPNPDLGLSGSVTLDVQARGDIRHDLTLMLELHSENLGMVDLEPFPLRMLLDVRALPRAPLGELTISASPLQTPLRLETAFTLEDTLLSLSDLELIVPKGVLHGQGTIDLDNQLVAARLQGRIQDIAPLVALAGLTMHGALELDLRLQPDESAQNIEFATNMHDFHSDFGVLASLALQGRMLDARGSPGIQIDFAARNFQSGATRVDAVDASLSGSLREMVLTSAAEGYALHPFRMRIEAAYAGQDGGHGVTVRDLTGEWAEQHILLTTPVSIALGELEQTVSPLYLELGQAILRAEARIGEQDADLRLGLENLPLDLIMPDVTGRLTAGAVLHGPKSGLRGDLTVLGHELAPGIINLESLPTLDLQADLALDGESVSLLVQLRETNGTTPLLQAQGRTLLTLALAPAGVTLPDDAPVTAALQGGLDLGWLGEIFLPDSQLLTGALQLDFQLSGTLDVPLPQGDIRIVQAGYQHLLHGVLLQEIEAEARIADQRFNLPALTATDGGQGRLRVEGAAELAPQRHFPFRFTVHMEGMNILDSPQVRARLAQVDLEAAGSTEGQTINGLVVLERVEVFLREVGGPRVAELPVVETNAPEARPVPQPTPSPPAPPVSLDMDVRFPNQVFVRGRGLDSEWGGALRIAGTAGEPDIRGEIRPRRGRLDLLGRRFTVEPDSLIQFTGGQPPLPFVNLTASQTRTDPDGEKRFTVRISGVPPDLDPPLLESTPPLPQDEILAQMLFGRSLSRISAIQAVQLALAARELAGHGSGLDLVGTARDLLQLDDLDLVSGAGGDMRLRAGKHVHERVYLRLDRDLNTGEETTSVEVELSPRVGVESSIGPQGSGLGLFWKRDY